jgi:hypothetical protein
MSASLLKNIESKAPGTQIKKFEEESLAGGANSKNLRFSVPVDFNIQDLLKRSISDENILKVNDLSWIPWM